MKEKDSNVKKEMHQKRRSINRRKEDYKEVEGG